MAEQRIFEARLADAFERFLDGAPVQVDAVSLTAAIATARPRRRFGLPSLTGLRGQPRWAVAVITLLLLGLVAAIFLVGRQLDTPPPVLPYRGVFTPVGSMIVSRDEPVVVVLADGRVLLAGGRVGSAVPAEIFDPATGDLTPFEGPTGRGTGALLPDGRVLLIVYDSNATSSRAFLFDPTDHTFEQLEHPGFSNAPPFGVEPSLVGLADGRVLVTGGLADVYGQDVLASALIFDPATGAFSPTGSMREQRRYHAAATLSDGRILVAAGEAKDGPVTEDDVGSHMAHRSWLDTVEVYDPQAGTFAAFGTLQNVRGAAIARVLPDGRVWIVPRSSANDEYWANMGQEPASPVGATVPTEILDAETSAFVAGPALPGPAATVSLLRDGRLLVTGEQADGFGDFGPIWVPWAAVYDPSSEALDVAPVPTRRLATAIVLEDGRVVFVGGYLGDYQQGATDWLEIYE